MSTPNVENYMLGRGSLYFTVLDTATGLYGTERHLGNAKDFSLNINATKLEHFTTMSGLKSKDKSVISQVAPTFTFTLDEFDEENWKLLVYGVSSAISQGASDGNTLVLGTPTKGKRYDLEKYNIQSKYLTHGAVTGTFAAAETITGGTSAATAVIAVVRTGELILKTISGTFQSGETITGGTSAAHAVTSSALLTTAGKVDVRQTNTPFTVYLPNSDYIVDPITGGITLTPNSDVSGSITITFGAAAFSGTLISALASLSQEGRLRFVSDNPEGGQYEMRAWRVMVSPDGDTGLLADSWAEMKFTGEVLRDLANHPTSPYMDLIIY